MKKRSLLLWLAAVAVGLVILPPLTLLFIPDAVVKQALVQVFAARGIKLQAGQIRTALPFGINATRLSFADTAATTWITLDQLSLQLRIASLVSGKLGCTITAKAGEGRLDGAVTLLPHLQGALQVRDLELSALPLLAIASGGSVKGIAQIDLTLHSPQATGVEGDARLLIRNVQLKDVRISGMPLPAVSFPELRGVVKIKGQTILIDNLALQGEGIYLRLGGTVPLSAGSPLNLSLELMPSAEFMEQQKTVFLFMALYQVSPGHYKLPITGTLASPQLAGK